MARGFHEVSDKPKRFYKVVDTVREPEGFAVLLDARSVRSPRGGRLLVPHEPLAQLIAKEWAAQTDVIELGNMHLTRLAFTAMEAIPTAREAIADQIADYAGSDLLCYFAEAPSELADRELAHWGPLLDRAETELGLKFLRASGIVHATQPAETLARVRELALELDDFNLAGLAFGVSLFGSTVLALGLHRGWLDGASAYDLSRLDEAFQEEKWGIDAEAAERTVRLRQEAVLLEQWFAAVKPA